MKENKMKTKNKNKNKNKNENENLNILILSSLFFITNIVSALYKKYYVYSFAFVFLTITSLLYHSNKNIYTNIFDKCGILFVVFYGGYMLYSKLKNVNKFIYIAILITFWLTIFFYFYGYVTKQYCFHSNISIGDKYHALIHLISSIGHHLIILL
jgi:hypothetical protein